MPRTLRFVLPLIVILLAGCTTPTPAQPTPIPATEPPPTATEEIIEPFVRDTAAILETLGGEPCPDSDLGLTCVTLTVPLDHFDPANSATTDVVFGLLPAVGERRGMFIVAVGGPGGSGLGVADSYIPYYQEALLEHFDMVFFDQRGVGLSGGLTCPDAIGAYYLADMNTSTPEGKAALAEVNRQFAADCITEMGVPPENLPFYATTQVAEDIEAFREAIGDPQIWLYGESYGTQLSQTYAAAHPDRLAALVLDGTVDLTLTSEEFYKQQAQAFNDVLYMTLDACNEDPVCAADFGGDAVAAWDTIAAELKTSPASMSFPLPSGGTAERAFTSSDLESAAIGYLSPEGSRTSFLRALAYAHRGDVVPLARLIYAYLTIDPETLAFIGDPGYYDAVYYVVECADYATYPGDSPEARAQAYLDAGASTDTSIPNFSAMFYGDLPCAFWPTSAPEERPAPLTLEGVPTIVLGATADTATPTNNGRSVFSRLANAAYIETDGGAHVTFAWGNACPDDMVTAFLVDGTMPAEKETRCEGVVIAPYEAIAPATAAEFADPLEALNSVYTEVNNLPEYLYWDGEMPLTIGCPYGGTLSFHTEQAGEGYTLTNCAFTAGFVMTGTGLYSYDAGAWSLDVDVTGQADGHLTYTYHDDPGAGSVTGTYGGQDIDLSD